MADRVERRSRTKDSENSRSGADEPPNSRLFIVCSKQLTEEDFRGAFSKFGDIEEIWVVKDRQSGERKGVTYIKYSKTSEAAAALEAMNGKTVGNSNRHVKVMIAASREQGCKREGNEEERVQRLFVIVPKTMTDDELYDHFKQFGDIDYASIIRDRETKESKGFAYVKFFKFSHAANAYENCDKKFRAVFAEPRRSKQSYEFPYDKFGPAVEQAHFSKGPYPFGASETTAGDGCTKLQVIASPMLNQDQLWKLCDLVPGLDYCQLRVEGSPRTCRAIATVVYTSAQWASYAKDKLHGFEYPPGHRLIVRPDPDPATQRAFPDSPFGSAGRGSAPATRPSNPLQTDLAHLAETIAQATSVIQAAGLTPDALSTRLSTTSTRDPDQPNYCNVKLPAVQPLADIDADTVARKNAACAATQMHLRRCRLEEHCVAVQQCFIVCTPQPPPIYALRDAFCRFGNLIDVYMLTNRNCGYAKYATKESAQMAIVTLHGSEICGIRLKVLEAEEPRNSEDRRKRIKIDDMI